MDTESAVSQLRLSATLPPPIGVNSTYRSGHRRLYKTRAATAWQETAILVLRSAGFRVQPPGRYRLTISVDLYTVALDLDGPLKALIDAVSTALDIDDRYLCELHARKHRVHHRAEQRLELWVEVRPAGDEQEH